MTVQDQGDVGLAFELYNHVLKMHADTIDENSPDYAMTLSDLATTFEELGDVEHAVVLCNQVLKLRRPPFVRTHLVMRRA